MALTGLIDVAVGLHWALIDTLALDIFPQMLERGQLGHGL